MKPSDVVICLSHQDRHIMRCRKGPSFLVGSRSLAKIIEAHVRPCHIVQRHRESFRIILLVKQEILVGTLVALQSLSEAVLSVENISEIQVQPCDAPAISLCPKDLARFPSGCESSTVPAQKNEGLNEGTQSARYLFGAARRPEKAQSFCMMFQCG